MFTNREIATMVWLAIILVIGLARQDVRSSMAAVIRAFLVSSIIISFLLMFSYNAISVTGLYLLGFWSIDMLKDTIIWFLFVAFPLTFSFVSSKEVTNIFKKIAIENFRFLVVVEFIIATYTFPFFVEFILIPIALVITLLDVVAKSNSKYTSVAKITSATQILLGLAVLSFSVHGAIVDYQNLLSIDIIKSLFLTPILSIIFSPFVFFLVLYTRYESLFILMNIGPVKTATVKRYAKQKILQTLRLNLNEIHNFHHKNGRRLIRIQTKDDVDSLFQGD